MLKDDVNSLIVVSCARIDNRKELSDLLSVPFKETSLLSPNQLILRCYKAWGKDCVKRLIGDWAFAIYDSGEKELFLARDHYGHSSIYYYHNNEFLVFSTDIKEVLSNPEVPKVLNENAIVQLSAGFKRDAQTFYKGIFQLPSAHTLTAKDGNLRIDNYWLPENFKPVRYTNDEDYVNHFLEIYAEAVNCRIGKQKTGIALSSGFDSGSTAVLAAPTLASENRNLEAFTWKTDLVDKPGLLEGRVIDETPLVKDLVSTMPATNWHIVYSKEQNIVSTILKNQEIFQQPSVPYVHINEIFEEASKQDIEVMLTGFWGNTTVSYAGDINKHFRDLLFTNPIAYIREVLSWKEHQHISWKGLLVKTLYKPVFKYSRPSPDKKDSVRSYLNSAAIQNALSNYQGFTPELEQKRRNLKYPYCNLINAFQSCAMGEVDTLANAYGIDVRTPVMDKRLIDFCLGIPNEQYIRGGHTKWLIRRAMKGKMPDSIVFAKKRGVQGADLVVKMIKEANEIQILLKKFRKSPLGSYWLDLDTIELFYKQILSYPIGYDESLFAKGSAVQRALALGVFFLKLEHA
ncbi:MAG: hypothetical protein JST82_14295 [Bacteroidetes bacterium]|nr:hypothetical protein [Bacteroidota bacterium]